MDREVSANIGVLVGRDADIKFLVNKLHPECLTLVIGDGVAEIAFAQSTVETLLDKATAALQRSREMGADKATQQRTS